MEEAQNGAKHGLRRLYSAQVHIKKKSFISTLCEETKKGHACVTKFHNVEIRNPT